MDESAPRGPVYDMNKFRRAMRDAWRTMRDQYREGVRRYWTGLYTTRDGWVLDWPVIEDFEIRNKRPKENLP